MKRPLGVWLILVFFLLNAGLLLWDYFPEIVNRLNSSPQMFLVDMASPILGVTLRGVGVIRLFQRKLDGWTFFFAALLLDFPFYVLILIGIAAAMTNPIALIFVLVSWTLPWLIITIYTYLLETPKTERIFR